MSSVVETAVKISTAVAEKVAQTNAVAGLLAGAGTFLAGVAALGIGDIVMKAMDNKKNANNNNTDTEEKGNIGIKCPICHKYTMFNNVCRNCGAKVVKN